MIPYNHNQSRRFTSAHFTSVGTVNGGCERQRSYRLQAAVRLHEGRHPTRVYRPHSLTRAFISFVFLSLFSHFILLSNKQQITQLEGKTRASIFFKKYKKPTVSW